jgi:hypothetical protein
MKMDFKREQVGEEIRYVHQEPGMTVVVHFAHPQGQERGIWAKVSVPDWDTESRRSN